ncbi:uncharacterized protein B0H18DRAFT_969690 [Fomitopsis serialis]|uniref:uncharacterized protein n=1 Tax=Fomitopsis serialis TaxID=139415 RepID=UPI0020088A88|nr:uncharacterized protein B0H18DRAFT_969690 [Neoantrodia serialis]KAH9937231.1 hypothetical protein B0H18DRAFT_969690 [Neoantrodia serialis]
MSPPPSLSRHSSLADRFSAALPPNKRPRLPSLRSRKSNAPLNGTDSRRNSYQPYSVYQQTMYPTILRDPDATNKLLEAILETPGGRRSLSRLARTCKAFQEPVLEILWRDLDSINPLIGLFPNTLLRRARRPGLGLARNPEPDDWARLLAYGERVRSISYVESSGSVSPSIFPIFEDLRPRKWLLPNLTSLTWKCKLFLGPELRSLTIEVGTKHPKLHDLLVEVASHARLSALSFTVHTNLPDNFTDIFQNNIALEKVCIAAPGALASRVGKWAATLPALRSFQIDLTGRTTTAVEGFFDDISPGSGYSTPSSVGGTDSGVFSGEEFDFSEVRKSAARLTQGGPRRGAFAQLSNLRVSGDAANVATFLKHITSPLTTLEVVIDDPPASEDWQDVCGLVCEQFGYTLQVFRVSASSASRFSELVRSTSRGGDAPTRYLPLSHLSYLPRLFCLDIDLPESVVFSEEDVAHLAKICPSLEILRLCPSARFPPSVGPPPLTLNGLAPLTQNCRRLHTVAVVVNAIEGKESIFSTRAVSSRSLLRLNVGHSYIRDPLQVAVLLSHFAPHLDVLRWFHEKNRAGVIETNAASWQKVSDFLPYLQDIRLRERQQQAPPPTPVYVPPPTAEKAIDATVITVDQGVLATPEVEDDGVQAEVELADMGVQISPEVESVSIDATPLLVDTGIMVIPAVAEHAVEARPESADKAVGVDDEVLPETASTQTGDKPSVSTYIPSPAMSVLSFTVAVYRFYTFPFRYMLSFMPSLSRSGATAMQIDSEPKSPVPGGMEDEAGSEKQGNGNPTDYAQPTDVSPVGP